MAFITQRGQKAQDATQLGDDLGELEALVSGVNQISQSTMLLKKMKEMHEVDDALDYMKEQYKARMEACDERQREFRRRQAEMKDQVVKFEKFIQENDSKRQRAEIKLKQEKKIFKQKVEEQDRLQTALEVAHHEEGRLVQELERLRRYRAYMDGTVDAGETSYEETWDLLNRHRTLKSANTDLMSHVQMGETEIDAMRMELSAINSAHTNRMLVKNSKIQEHQKHVEELRILNKHKTDEKEREEEGMKNENRQVGQVMLAIRNLYLRCIAGQRAAAMSVNESRTPAEKLKEVSSYLQAVCERIVDLRDIDSGFEEWQERRLQDKAQKQQAQDGSRRGGQPAGPGGSGTVTPGFSLAEESEDGFTHTSRREQGRSKS